MAQTVSFPRITANLVVAGSWVANDEWYRFFETLWQRTGGDSDLVDEANITGAGLQLQISAIKAYTLTGTEILINGLTSRQLLNAPLAFSLAPTAVTAAAYGGAGKWASFTVDAKGRLTLAAAGDLDADDIDFDPGASGLISTNVGDALRELKALIDAI